MDTDTPKQLSREQRWETVRSLLQRSDIAHQAKQAFRRSYPNASEKMLETAVFHTYVDGIGAAIDWLVDLECFLHDDSHELDTGLTFHLLYHLYNWHQFHTLLPDGKSGVVERLKEIKELVSDNDLEGILVTVGKIESVFEGCQNPPNFD